MFTGIVEERGEVVDLAVTDADAGSARLTVRGPLVTQDAGHGDSISVSGVCLTVVDRTADTFTVDVMAETLKRSTIGDAGPRRRGQSGAVRHADHQAGRPHRAGSRRRHRHRHRPNRASRRMTRSGSRSAPTWRATWRARAPSRSTESR